MADLSKATPRPWEAVGDSVFGADGYEVADCSSVHLHKDYDAERGHWGRVPGSHRELSEEEELANAALTAKATTSYDRLLRVEKLAGELGILAENVDICDVEVLKDKARELKAEIGRGQHEAEARALVCV